MIIINWKEKKHKVQNYNIKPWLETGLGWRIFNKVNAILNSSYLKFYNIETVMGGTDG